MAIALLFVSISISIIMMMLGPAYSLSTNQNNQLQANTPPKLYRIVAPGTAPQFLPASYVRTFSRWTADAAVGNRVSAESDPINGENRDTVVLRPTLDVLLQSGVPKYVLAGLWSSAEDNAAQQEPWLAQQWLPFAWASQPNFRVLVYHNLPNDEDTRELFESAADQVKSILEHLAAVVVGNEDDTSPNFEQGLHLLSFPLTPNGLRVAAAGTLSCLATAEENGRELLTLVDDPADLLSMTVTSILQRPVVLGEASDQ